MTTLKTILVDDEDLARRGLKLRLQDNPNIELIAECSNGREAIDAVAEHSPDLMFLDIQMPELDGFDVVRELQGDGMPMVIFVTAFDQYALDAFKVHAIDYVLKPVDTERLEEAVARAVDQHDQHAEVDQKEKLMELVVGMTGKTKEAIAEMVRSNETEAGAFPERISIKDGSNINVVPVGDIDWVDAAGDYMCIHVKGETHVMRITMKELEAMLNPSIFQRVHRSTIVNMNRVQKVSSHLNGEYQLSLDCGANLKMSRGYKDKIKRFL